MWGSFQTADFQAQLCISWTQYGTELPPKEAPFVQKAVLVNHQPSENWAMGGARMGAKDAMAFHEDRGGGRGLLPGYQGLERCSVLSTAGCPCRRPSLISKQPHVGSQTSLTPVLGDWIPVSGLSRHCTHVMHRHPCRQNTHRHKNRNKIK